MRGENPLNHVTGVPQRSAYGDELVDAWHMSDTFG